MASTEKYKDVKNYFNVHFSILKIFGIAVEDFPDETVKFAYNFYAGACIGLFFYWYSIAELIDLIQHFTDIETLTFTSTYLLSHVIGNCKLTLVLINRKRIANFCKIIETGIFLPSMKRGGIKEFEIIKSSIKVYNRQAYFFHCFVVIIVGQRGLYAYFNEGVYRNTFDPVTNETASRLIRVSPFHSWYPFDQLDTPHYEINFSYQIISATFFGFVIGSCDAIICGIMVHIKAQFLILSNSLSRFLEQAADLMESDGEHIDITKYQNFKLFENGTSVVEKIPEKLQKYVDIIIEECVSHHQEIFALSEGAEQTFYLVMLVQFLGSCILICFSMFQLSLYEITSFRFFSMVCYCMLMMFQVLVFCWHGNEVQLVSEDFKDAVFSCNWLVTDLKTQKALILMMERAHRPIRMTAGKFAFLSLETFTKILRGSGSYFMVLRNVNEQI